MPVWSYDPNLTGPQRPQYWAVKIIRLMAKSCAAQEIGATGFALVSIIATTEDAAGYCRPVTFYDGQLMPLVGLESQKALAGARRRCIEAGWLHYEAGCKAKPSRYWVITPNHADGLSDHPTDEGTDDSRQLPRKKDDELANETEVIPRQKDVPSGGKRQGKGDDATGQRSTFLPIPIPTPIPKTRKKPVGFYGRVDLGILKDTSKLMEWLKLSTEPDLSAGDEQTRLRVIGLAVHVTSCPAIEKPVAAFVGLVKDRNWKTITGADEDKAGRRHRSWMDSVAPALAGVQQFVPSDFGAMPPEPTKMLVGTARAEFIAAGFNPDKPTNGRAPCKRPA